MTEFFLDYGLFLAKTLTVVLLFVMLVIFIVGMAAKKQTVSKDSIEIKKLNKKYDDMAMALNMGIMSKDEFKKYLKQEKHKAKDRDKHKADKDEARRNLYVLNFNGDIRASAVASLREEITAVLTVAKKTDEVFVRLESGGGVVHGYGLAASQLMRIRDREIPLTISVDKVAASGGYMMACVGNRILAAPFAIIGAIGVVAQLPNFNKVLKKHDIDFEQFTAGEFKRTVTVFGENTDEVKNKFREEIEDIHLLFKEFITRHRPGLDIVSVSTGESWPGIRALEKNLIDELKTSDDYLLDNREQADIFEVTYTSKKSIGEKMGFHMQRLMDKWRYQGQWD